MCVCGIAIQKATHPKPSILRIRIHVIELHAHTHCIIQGCTTPNKCRYILLCPLKGCQRRKNLDGEDATTISLFEVYL